MDSFENKTHKLSGNLPQHALHSFVLSRTAQMLFDPRKINNKDLI